eukprot:4818332-Pleurochrysis_carterae.AAC.1
MSGSVTTGTSSVDLSALASTRRICSSTWTSSESIPLLDDGLSVRADTEESWRDETAGHSLAPSLIESLHDASAASSASSAPSAATRAVATAGKAARSASACTARRSDGGCGVCTCASPEWRISCTAAPVCACTRRAAERRSASCLRVGSTLRARADKRTCAIGDDALLSTCKCTTCAAPASTPASSPASMPASAPARAAAPPPAPAVDMASESAACIAAEAAETRVSRSGSACSSSSAAMACTVA